MSQLSDPYLTEGFTLIEIIVVMLLMAIISVSVIPTWNSASVNLNHQADLLVRNLRHAQALSLHRAATLTVDLSTEGYSIKNSGGSIITDPATGNQFSVTLEDGVTFSAWSDFDLDSLGRPTNGVSLISIDTLQTMSGGTRTKTITITPVTGTVSVAEG